MLLMNFDLDYFWWKHAFASISICNVWEHILIGFLLLFVLADVKRDHCNKTVDIYEDVSSPEVTADTVGRPMTCWYRFRSFRGTPRDWILRIRFKKFKVGTLLNATTCHMGYMQVCLKNKECHFIFI